MLTPSYFERRVETLRIFVSSSIESETVKSIPRARLTLRWGSTPTHPHPQALSFLFTSTVKAERAQEQLARKLLDDGFMRYSGPDDPALIAQRDSLYQDALDTIERLKRDDPEMACFGNPGDLALLDVLEETWEVRFPSSYRTFLSRFNGGGFRDPVHPRFYSIDQIEEEHSFIRQHWTHQHHRDAYLQMKAFPIAKLHFAGCIAMLRTSQNRSEQPVLLLDIRDVPDPSNPPMFDSFQDFIVCMVDQRDQEFPRRTAAAHNWHPPDLVFDGLHPDTRS